MGVEGPLPTSGKAIASLVLGVLALFGGGSCVTAIPGIILGHMALADIRQGLYSGEGIARAGVIMSWFALVVMILLVALVFLLGMFPSI